MKEESKKAIHIALDILKKTCIEEGVSMAVDKDTGDLYFFDTETYVSSGEYKGIKVKLQDLVS